MQINCFVGSKSVKAQKHATVLSPFGECPAEEEKTSSWSRSPGEAGTALPLSPCSGYDAQHGSSCINLFHVYQDELYPNIARFLSCSLGSVQVVGSLGGLLRCWDPYKVIWQDLTSHSWHSAWMGAVRCKTITKSLANGLCQLGSSKSFAFLRQTSDDLLAKTSPSHWMASMNKD